MPGQSIETVESVRECSGGTEWSTARGNCLFARPGPRTVVVRQEKAAAKRSIS